MPRKQSINVTVQIDKATLTEAIQDAQINAAPQIAPEVISESILAAIEQHKTNEMILADKNAATNYTRVIITGMLWVIGGTAGLFALGFAIMVFGVFGRAGDSLPTKITLSILCGALTTILATISYITFVTASRIQKENDRQFLASFLACIASTVALLISILQYVK
ncbi:hypothetical protein [Butyricicoccus sp. Marseille-Q5471]|uniref:hypothetical protein n=1 Tax=Butyricicoccus sp. Marseille-Q5471 TaxID=3039493 RepID=UPI0024BC757C|nr:hypothetical protein [Butyricicoccus sp. Marseille-Q5471]